MSVHFTSWKVQWPAQLCPRALTAPEWLMKTVHWCWIDNPSQDNCGVIAKDDFRLCKSARLGALREEKGITRHRASWLAISEINCMGAMTFNMQLSVVAPYLQEVCCAAFLHSCPFYLSRANKSVKEMPSCCLGGQSNLAML